MLHIIGCSLDFFDELRILSLRSGLQDLDEFSVIISLNKLFSPFFLFMTSRVPGTQRTILNKNSNKKCSFQRGTQELHAVTLAELSTETKQKRNKTAISQFLTGRDLTSYFPSFFLRFQFLIILLVGADGKPILLGAV